MADEDTSLSTKAKLAGQRTMSGLERGVEWLGRKAETGLRKARRVRRLGRYFGSR